MLKYINDRFGVFLAILAVFGFFWLGYYSYHAENASYDVQGLNKLSWQLTRPLAKRQGEVLADVYGLIKEDDDRPINIFGEKR